MICLTVIRLFESGSSIFRSSDNANVSNLLHGVIVTHELSLFHFTNSEQPVVGSSHGNSVIYHYNLIYINILFSH